MTAYRLPWMERTLMIGMFVVALLFLIAIGILIDARGQAESAKDETLTNRDIGFQNRAAYCEVLKVNLSTGTYDKLEICKDPRVTAHMLP